LKGNRCWGKRADNSNHELIFYYADYAHDPAQALQVAQMEYARRQDVFTRDSYAWALYRNGRYKEATEQIQTALAVGIRDARLFRHAGEIALKSGNTDQALRYLQLSAQLNTVGSEQARAILARFSSVTLER
jgi:tetratricopeptide (TPR) repeat protein